MSSEFLSRPGSLAEDASASSCNFIYPNPSFPHQSLPPRSPSCIIYLALLSLNVSFRHVQLSAFSVCTPFSSFNHFVTRLPASTPRLACSPTSAQQNCRRLAVRHTRRDT